MLQVGVNPPRWKLNIQLHLVVLQLMLLPFTVDAAYVVRFENGSAVPLPVHYHFVTLETSEPDPTYPKLTARILSSVTSSTCMGALDVLFLSHATVPSQVDHYHYKYVIRFRPVECCVKPVLRLSVMGKTVGAVDGYPLGEFLLPDDCEPLTPLPSISHWIYSAECSSRHQRLIESDLQPWILLGGINMTLESKRASNLWQAGSKSHAWCHYKVVKNVIFRRCYGIYADFKQFMDSLLMSLTRKITLPDFEFLMNLGDWPLVTRKSKDDSTPVPMISWCGSADTSDIVAPTYESTESVLEMLRRVTLDTFTAIHYGATAPPFHDKVDKLFFRGRDSNRRRLDLVAMSRASPDDIDAGITRYFFFSDEAASYGPPLGQRQFKDFFKFRYHMNVDGTVAAYRLQFLLAGNVTVFKQDSKYYEHFYRLLEPNVHYIPVEEDLSDLRDKLKFVKQNIEKAQRIAMAGRDFVVEHLTPRHVICYYAQLFKNQLSDQMMTRALNMFQTKTYQNRIHAAVVRNPM